MEDRETDPPTAEALAASLEVLPEWDRLRVRDFWDAVCTEELRSRPSNASLSALNEFPAEPIDEPDATILRLTRIASPSGESDSHESAA